MELEIHQQTDGTERVNERGGGRGYEQPHPGLSCWFICLYLLEPEGEPAIAPGREKEKEGEMSTCLLMQCLNT